MIMKRFTKQRAAKQFHYMPRYGDDKKFNIIYRSIGKMGYAESYATKKFDDKKRLLKNENSANNSYDQTAEKRIQFQRSDRRQYSSSKMIFLILGALIILVLALFGFDITFFFDK